ncbi:hypothetical protein G3A43_08015 [Paraburkholderia aspalathi]|nr:hypothetical protein [Paraburkholderia aspalathi]MBK3780201.1 hypothetical protein [Paraburkholderia aspalathi]
MSKEATLFTPGSLIAGRVPVTGNVDTYTSAFHSAAAALDDERIQIVAVRSADSIYYLAAPAQDFASVASPAATPLAQALPGWAGHEGPGYYWTNLRGGLVAVVQVTDDGDISVFTGLRVDAERFAGTDTRQFTPAKPSEWVSVTREAQRSLRALARRVALVSFAAGAVMLLAAVATTGIAVKKSSAHATSASLYQESVTQAAGALGRDGVHGDVWRNFVNFAHAVIERQGRAMKYADDGKGQVGYEVMLPVWTKDFTPFDGATRKDEGSMYLTLTKGGLK